MRPLQRVLNVVSYRLLSSAQRSDPGFVLVRSISSHGNRQHDQNEGASRGLIGALGLGMLSFGLTAWPVAAKAPAPAAPTAHSTSGKPSDSTLEGKKEDPSFTTEEVSKHRDRASGIWVTYHGEVYDITEFIEAHPGGMQKIMMAAGGSIEPFWSVYKQHDKDEVRKILAKYRIGSLVGGAAASAGRALEDPFKADPARHPALLQHSSKPCNAETPAEMLSAQIITPTELFYVRNHLPVPDIDLKTWRLKIQGEGLRTIELSMEELQTKFKKHVIPSTIQCAGNRRSEMKSVKPVKGLDWNVGAIGTAVWGGVLLKEVLEYAGLSPEDAARVAHIHFVGLDSDPLSGEVYAASIPVHKALSGDSEVLLAYEMNGQPLTRDHGFPLRTVAPGIIGARNVKWLGKIVASSEESDSFWQKKDYKFFSPNVDWDNVDWDSAPAIQEAPITSAVCEPSPGSEVYLSDGEVTARGYAWSGGGRDVIRVDVSLDDGNTWQLAQLKKLPQRPGKNWAWCLWETTLKLPPGAQPGSKLRLTCRAVDDNMSAQPDGIGAIWNMRGVNNNAWHRVELTVV